MDDWQMCKFCIKLIVGAGSSLIVGFFFAMWCVLRRLEKSNDFGNIKAELEDFFTQPMLKFTHQKDDIDRKKDLYHLMIHS